MAAAANLVDLISRIEPTSTLPESYFHPSKQLSEDLIQSLKWVFDISRQNGDVVDNESCLIKELMVEGFDDEQIWQQIELQNDPVLSGIRRQLKHIKGLQDNLKIFTDTLDKYYGKENENDVEFDDDDALSDTDQINGHHEMIPASSSDDDDGIDYNEYENLTSSCLKDDHASTKQSDSIKRKEKQRQKNTKGSVVDDRFFKLSEMTEFLDKMDQQFERDRDSKRKTDDDDDDDEDEVEFFRDDSSEEEENAEDDIEDWGDVLGNTAKMIGRDQNQNKPKAVAELKYNDYFDPPKDYRRAKRQCKEEIGESVKFEDDLDNGDYNENDGSGDEESQAMETDDDQAIEDEDDNSERPGITEEDKEQITEDCTLGNSEKSSLSRHEEEQAKLKKKIAQLEKENLTKKPWQMSGEAGSTARPVNSLLEEDLNFDHTTAVAPPITEETTKELEDIIKQRIKDEAWDDVERKQKPVTEPFEYKKKLPLDQEKSKLSLSQIYEQEYIKQTEVKEATEKQELEEHKEIKELMKKLFTKLDALSNFHFTPKPLKPELRIVTNTPAINMEEVAPVSVSDAMLLAPEETQEKEVELKGDSEKTETDRKRERRSKKLCQRMKAKEKEKKSKLVSKLKPALGNKYSKKKALERIEKASKTSKNLSLINEDTAEKALKSSSAFFSRLHDEVKQQVNSKKVINKKRKIKTSTSNLRL